MRPTALPPGRKLSGQPRHHEAFCRRLPIEQVDEIVVVVPEYCRHCQQPFPETTTRGWGRAWQHQAVELLPLVVRVTEYQDGGAAVCALWPPDACQSPARGAAPTLRPPADCGGGLAGGVETTTPGSERLRQMN